MKKIFLTISCFLLLSISLSARTVITNYENPEITAEDIIECFVEELNKPRYAYGIYDYDVYKTKDNQNNVWSVEVSDCSYEKGQDTIWGEQVTLFVSNGYFSLKTFGGETQLSTIANGVVKAADLNDEDECNDFYYDLIYDLQDFAEKSHKWLKKYKSDQSKSMDISELYYINYHDFFGFVYTPFIEKYGSFYDKLSYEDINIDLTKAKAADISDRFILKFMDMTNYSYPIGTCLLNIEFEEDYPNKYDKVLSDFYYLKIFNTDKKEYCYLSLTVSSKTTEEQIIKIPLNKSYSEDELINDEIINLVATELGEDVYYQGLFEQYEKEMK